MFLAAALTVVGGGAGASGAGKPGPQDVSSFAASSEQQSNTANGAFDRSFDTRWESNHGVDPSWLQINFKRKVALSSVLITWEGASAKKYKLQAGLDEDGWADVAGVENGEAGEERYLKFKTIKTDRIRIYCSERATQWGYSIWEIEFNAPEPARPKAVNLKEGNIPFMNAKLPIKERIENLISHMTLDEKIAEMTGKDTFDGRTNERLGIPPLLMADGPHGIRFFGEATCYPSVVACASWDDGLMRRIGAAIAQEARAKGRNLVLGPCVNIHRTPLGGRNFESFSEDPYLSGRMAVAYIKGMQDEKIGACVKHFACNNQEWERDKISVEISERALREIYLPAFEAAVKEGGVISAMGAYNKVNGEYCCENPHLLTDILKNEWGFKGFVVSDWGAIHGTEIDALAGSDLEMGGPGYFFTKAKMIPAVRKGSVPEAVIDDKVRRILYAKYYLGLFDGVEKEYSGSANTKEHQALAREAAENGMVLLKNNNKVLPLDINKIKSVAVIGPCAKKATLDGAGSSEVTPPYNIGVLEAMEKKCRGKAAVNYAKGCDMLNDWTDLTVKGKVPKGAGKALVKCVSRNMASGKGLSFIWFDCGSLTASSAEGREMLVNRSFDSKADGWKITGNTGNSGAFEWHSFDGKASCGMGNDNGPANAAGEITQQVELPPDVKPGDVLTFTMWAKTEANYTGKSGLVLEFLDARDEVLASNSVEMFSDKPEKDRAMIEEAVRAAKASDAAVIVAGLGKFVEGEGTDRVHMRLPDGQDELIEAVVKANKNTTVVLINGTPVEMGRWIDGAQCVIEAFYPGQEGGNAIVGALFGDVNPSGKLPVSFPKKLEDNPSYGNYPGKDGKVYYAEDIYVGYRYYDTKKVEPQFPFGHGLSYTEFEYGALKLEEPGAAGYPVKASIEVRNAGTREGKEVIQIYVRDAESSLERPEKELKAYRKVSLKPGETRTVEFELDKRAFSFYSPEKKKWVIESGVFEILAGSSSRDIRSKAVYTAKNGTEF